MPRPWSRISPWRLAAGMSSFIRLSARRKVDFPQPDGPMRAVTCRSGIRSDTAFTATFGPDEIGGPRGEHVRVVAEVHELRERGARQVGEEVGDAGEQDRGDLAGAAGDGEDRA